jgi:hypothetical protein
MATRRGIRRIRMDYGTKDTGITGFRDWGISTFVLIPESGNPEIPVSFLQ